MCRELSRCLYSLSSAGDVCWAKPNHAFSDCQQLRSFFFPRRRRGVAAVGVRRGASNDPDTGSEDHALHSCISQMALFKGFAKCTFVGARRRHGNRIGTRRVRRRSFRGREDARKKISGQAPVSRRTSPIARKCANPTSRSTHSRTACRTCRNTFDGMSAHSHRATHSRLAPDLQRRLHAVMRDADGCAANAVGDVLDGTGCAKTHRTVTSRNAYDSAKKTGRTRRPVG